MQLAFGEDLAGGDWRSYGDRLRELRVARALSLRVAAALLGYKAMGGLQALEAERVSLDLAQAELIAFAYGVRAPWLAFGVGPRER